MLGFTKSLKSLKFQSSKPGIVFKQWSNQSINELQSYIKQFLGGASEIDVEALKHENEELKHKVEELQARIEELTSAVSLILYLVNSSDLQLLLCPFHEISLPLRINKELQLTQLKLERMNSNTNVEYRLKYIFQ